jgi:hypothetical protein
MDPHRSAARREVLWRSRQREDHRIGDARGGAGLSVETRRNEHADQHERDGGQHAVSPMEPVAKRATNPR